MDYYQNAKHKSARRFSRLVTRRDKSQSMTVSKGNCSSPNSLNTNFNKQAQCVLVISITMLTTVRFPLAKPLWKFESLLVLLGDTKLSETTSGQTLNGTLLTTRSARSPQIKFLHLIICQSLNSDHRWRVINDQGRGITILISCCHSPSPIFHHIRGSRHLATH